MISDQDVVELACSKSYEKMSVGENFTVNNNNYQVVELFNQDNGYKYGLDSMLVKNELNEYCLIFTGSDKRDDFYNDWVLNNGSLLIGKNAIQYELGLDLVEELENKGIVISKVGGVSLGGGISSYIGIFRSDLDIISINPAPQAKPYTGGYYNIKVIIDTNDALYKAISFSGRKDYVPGEIYSFTRGNDFTDFTLNHKGDFKNDFRTLDDSMPFDLLTNNLKLNTIEFNSTDLFSLNNSLSDRLDNYRVEYDTFVYGSLSNLAKENLDETNLEAVFIKIVDEIDVYLYSCFPTLRSYVDLSYIFDEIKSAIHVISDSIVVELLENLISDSNITSFKQRVCNDCCDAISNFNTINQVLNSTTNSLSTLVNGFVATDNGKIYRNSIYMKSNNLKVKEATTNLSYFKYFDEAKDLLYNYITKFVSNKFVTVDNTIDTYLFPVKAVVSGTNEVLKIVSQDLQRKVEVYKLIIDEFYNFNIGEFVSNLLLIFCDQLINLVIPITIDDIVSKLKYLCGIIGNIDVSHLNYINYIENVKGFSFTKLYDFNSIFNAQIKKYKSYLSKTYI